MRAPASVVLSYRIERGTLPKNAKAPLCPSQNGGLRQMGLDKTGVAVRQVHC